ncbi:MAG: response regulator [Acidobacteriota bacterium]|nr:response regulator [Acidobacteriota bacterium]
MIANGRSTVLIIEDEPQIRRAVKNALPAEVSKVLEAETGSRGIDLASAERPALIVLDLGLPDMEGLAVCRELRAWSNASIIVLSARHSDSEKVALLEAGADDYITKPFSLLELTARIRVNLRRAQAGGAGLGANPVLIRDLVIDLTARTVGRQAQIVHLTPIEWELLRTLVTQPGKTLTHQQIFPAVWGSSAGNPQHHLRVHVANLRRKMEHDPLLPTIILTEPGVGYRLELTG